ncbi:histidine phosphatase family protein [Levilactobacillus bambusae]|uniref:Histidine phosphatase family protein n=1 Tax=Levilactobacillus bambusae TaxID=2024736 RepID=A0A2V1MYE0_9LACO|nr:histidine phosphatase family protein [Levilactobacillus bambusae]PWG00031.1 histidine phosphatase family protein [Levilactobacillus bambusae]
MSYHIYFIRHGQTQLNRYHRIQGWADSPLTKSGIEDAQRVGQRLADIPFASAFSSDMTRARDTAAYIIAVNRGPVQDADVNPDFREENFGYFEGNDDVNLWHMIAGIEPYNSFNQLIAAWGLSAVQDKIHAQDPFGDADTAAELWDRISRGLKTVDDQAQDGDDVLVVAHGTMIRSIVEHFAPDINIAESTKNGSVTKLTVDNGQITVDYFNNTEGSL